MFSKIRLDIYNSMWSANKVVVVVVVVVGLDRDKSDTSMKFGT